MTERDNTKINLKHYIGKPFKNDAVAISTAFALAFAGAAGTGIGTYNAMSVAPDDVGTERADEVYQNILGGIGALEAQQTEIEIAKNQLEIDRMQGLSDEALREAQNNLGTLKTDFAFAGKNILLDMFLHGERGAEADISEQQFLELSQVFADRVGPTQDFGLEITRKTAANLDEARIALGERDGYTGNPIADARQLKEITSTKSANAEGASILAGLGGFFAAGVLGMIGAIKLNGWGHQPACTRRREKPKKQKQFNH